MDEGYLEFLRSLDDSSFISYVRDLSQGRPGNSFTAGLDLEKSPSLEKNAFNSTGLTNGFNTDKQSVPEKDQFNAQSTPTKAEAAKSFPSVSTDPFDDGLDEVLVNYNPQGIRKVEECPESETHPEEKKAETDHETDHDSDSEDEVIGKLHSFGDYTSYFQNKKLKQQKQDAEYINWESRRRDEELPPPIFKDCAIHVNGYTNPSINELHRIIILHGGTFVNYLNKKSSATHIICDKLTPRKMIEFKHCKVVQAQWIVDSILQKKLLKWMDYRLIQEVDSDQKKLPFLKGDQQEVFEDEMDDVPLEISKDPQLSQADLGHLEDSDSDPENDLPLLTQPENELIVPPNNDNNKKIIVDANDPDFLPHFFANSRLHHLSTWKADLRLRFLRRIVKEGSQYTSQKADPGHKVIMHIDFDCFFATASCLNYPKLDINAAPIAVTHGGRTSDIASCNYVARKAGVTNGMWYKRAIKLCPQLISLTYDFDGYERISSVLYNHLLGLKIFDSIFPVLIDEALVDVSSYVRDNESSECIDNLCTKIRKEVFELTKCSVSIGVSRNVLLAKLALKNAKPNGQFHLVNNIQEHLKKVRVRDLPGVGHSVKEKLLLEMPSIIDEPLIEDLLRYEKSNLMKIFGSKTGAKLYEYARGEDDTSITIDTSNPESVLGRKSVSVDVNYGIRFENFVQLEDFLMRLSREIHKRMVALGVCGSTVTVRLARRAAEAPVEPEKHLGMGWCSFVNKSSRLGVPTNDWGVIGSEIKALCRMLNIPPKELRGVSITMTRLEDVDTVKKHRQTRLPFGKAGTKKTAELTTLAPQRTFTSETTDRLHLKVVDEQKPISPTITQFRKKADGLELGIDWEVFDSLPDDIKRELKSELTRRGLSTRILPQKGKAYQQQLIPSQLGAMPKFVRTVDRPKSPSKSPSKRRRIEVPVEMPHAPKTSENFNYSDSYDSSVINELPTFIQKQVLRDQEYLEKVKKYDLEPLKEKIARKNLEKMAEIVEVNESWVSQGKKLIESPTFLDNSTSYMQLCKSLETWIGESLSQRGPHVEDVLVFKEYLQCLLEQHSLSRCLTLFGHMKKVLSLHESLLMGGNSSDEFTRDGIEDWRVHLASEIVPLLQDYCDSKGILLDL